MHSFAHVHWLKMALQQMPQSLMFSHVFIQSLETMDGHACVHAYEILSCACELYT